MKLIIPDYYDDFKCIAGECSDSCCQGWGKIEIDNITYDKYQKLGDDFSKLIKRNITSNNGCNTFVLENSKCPFLNKDKLCDIYINEGESFLCTTCKMYPRFIYEKNEVMYTSLTMSCPVVTDMIIDRKDNIKFYQISEGKRKEFYLDDVSFMYSHNGISLWMKLALLSLGCIEEVDNELLDHIRKIPCGNDLKIDIVLEYISIFYELTKETQGYVKCREILKDILDNYSNEAFLKKIYDEYLLFYQENKEIEEEFENYIIYCLYKNYIANVKEEFYMMVISAVSLFFTQAMYYAKYGHIDKQIRKYFFQIHSKTFEHSKKMRQEIINRFAKNNYLSDAVVLLLVKN